jgi:hypothetical protein
MARGQARDVDRRVRRSRQVLHQALVELVLERGWDRVTVQAVCDRARVGRSTFDVHFADKEEHLEQTRGAAKPCLSGLAARCRHPRCSQKRLLAVGSRITPGPAPHGPAPHGHSARQEDGDVAVLRRRDIHRRSGQQISYKRLGEHPGSTSLPRRRIADGLHLIPERS